MSDPIEAYVDAAATLNGLVLSPESRAAVIANTRGLRRMAEAFAALELEPGFDPAPVYFPPEARS